MNKVILSFDFEIGWGDITNGIWRHREYSGVYKRLRTILPEILQIMDDYDIRTTWATVGAMIEKPELRDFSHLTNAQRIVIEKSINDAESHTFNGIDLFEAVLKTKTNHQIVSHSYSHIPFDYEGMNGEIAREEFRRFNNVLAKFDLSTNKHVFPENIEKFYAELHEAGVEKVRVSADNFFSNRILYLLSLAVIPPPSSKELFNNTGVIRHYGSMLFHDAGNANRIPLLERRVKLGLNNVINKNYNLHIWAHPFNFAESEKLLLSFKKLIKHIAGLRDEGKLLVDFM